MEDLPPSTSGAEASAQTWLDRARTLARTDRAGAARQASARDEAAVAPLDPSGPWPIRPQRARDAVIYSGYQPDASIVLLPARREAEAISDRSLAAEGAALAAPALCRERRANPAKDFYLISQIVAASLCVQTLESAGEPDVGDWAAHIREALRQLDGDRARRVCDAVTALRHRLAGPSVPCRQRTGRPDAVTCRTHQAPPTA